MNVTPAALLAACRWDSGSEAMLYLDGPTPRQGITDQRNEYLLAPAAVAGQVGPVGVVVASWLARHGVARASTWKRGASSRGSRQGWTGQGGWQAARVAAAHDVGAGAAVIMPSAIIHATMVPSTPASDL